MMDHRKIKTVILIFFLISIFQVVFADSINAEKNTDAYTFQYGSVPVLILSGNYKKMGRQYGRVLQAQLSNELGILKRYYLGKGVTYASMIKQANALYNRFPLHYQYFLRGEAHGSGLSLNEVKILNAMETLGELLPHQQNVKCAFLFIPSTNTETGAAIIGRNYDYPAPFNQLARNLTVTIINRADTVSTAFISLAGEIYCPSCVNAKGIFMELNNGTPSGGHSVNLDRQSLLINMLTTLQNSTSLAQVEKQMNATQSDYSLIVNTANKNRAESYEFSSTLGMKFYDAENEAPFAVTNFYLDPDWGNEIPTPTDATTWMGVTRRNNLLNLANTSQAFNVHRFEKLMNTDISHGGALWNFTIYQLIFDQSDMSLYIKIVPESNHWVKIPLGELFSTDTENKKA